MSACADRTPSNEYATSWEFLTFNFGVSSIPHPLTPYGGGPALFNSITWITVPSSCLLMSIKPFMKTVNLDNIIHYTLQESYMSLIDERYAYLVKLLSGKIKNTHNHTNEQMIPTVINDIIGMKLELRTTTTNLASPSSL